MYRSMGHVTLKTGETVEMGVVEGPDADWADRIEDLLAHKGDPWTWQNRSVLREDVGLEARFYLLHRGGQPLANIMTAELAQVGLFGHVWTQPPDRRKGAATRLMAGQMDDFRRRGGKALFLGTGFDSPAYHIYRRHGFRGLEDRSGDMAYFTDSKEEFEAGYFAGRTVEVQEIGWRHWPASAALFTGDFDGVVRCVPIGLIGRSSTEGPLLGLIRDEQRRPPDEPAAQPAALALVSTDTTAVVGLAVRARSRTWPGRLVVDVYCSPAHWSRAGELLAGVLPDGARRCVAYADADFPAKHDALARAGFRPIATLPEWSPADPAATRFVDVTVFERRLS